MDGELEWFVFSLYGEERGDELSLLFEEDARKVSAEILASLQAYMARPEPKTSASLIRSRVSNLQENGESVCMLVFMTLFKESEQPSQHAIFLGPQSYVYAKGKEIMAQFESFCEKEGQDGDICLVQLPK